MNDDLIATDHPLTISQQQILAKLLDTLLPASEDGNMPSAQTLDLIGYLSETEAPFIPILIDIVDNFDAQFADLSLSDRVHALSAFGQAQSEPFKQLLFHTYACYYQEDQVLEGIGLSARPPFPTGNSIEAGDLSLLDPVMRESKTYRK